MVERDVGPQLPALPEGLKAREKEEPVFRFEVYQTPDEVFTIYMSAPTIYFKVPKYGLNLNAERRLAQAELKTKMIEALMNGEWTFK